MKKIKKVEKTVKKERLQRNKTTIEGKIHFLMILHFSFVPEPKAHGSSFSLIMLARTFTCSNKNISTKSTFSFLKLGRI